MDNLHHSTAIVRISLTIFSGSFPTVLPTEIAAGRVGLAVRAGQKRRLASCRAASPRQGGFGLCLACLGGRHLLSLPAQFRAGEIGGESHEYAQFHRSTRCGGIPLCQSATLAAQDAARSQSATALLMVMTVQRQSRGQGHAHRLHAMPRHKHGGFRLDQRD